MNVLAQQFGKAFSNGVSNTHPLRAPADLGMSARDYAATLVNVSVQQRTNCTSGGYINVLGSMTGSIDQNGSGVLSLQVTESINGWKCDGGWTIDGDPYLSAAGTFPFLNGALSSAASISFGGGFRYTGPVSGSCSEQMTLLLYQNGSGHLSGTMCGRQVDVTFQ
ncbi:MAG TPA: hypothetical protein VFT41_13380 [Gemmatimonadaceae bacterium]|nr:hypothetical protein [Gemmatimonadaceae bacterium]